MGRISTSGSMVTSGPIPRGGGIHDGYAVVHMHAVDALLQHLGGLSKLTAGINAQAFGCVFGLQAKNALALIASNAQNIGKVVLALRIVGRNFFQRSKQGFDVEAVEAGIAFRYRSLFRRAVFLLDDFLNVACRIADNAAVARGVFRFHGQNNHGGVGLLRACEQAQRWFRRVPAGNRP